MCVFVEIICLILFNSNTWPAAYYCRRLLRDRGKENMLYFKLRLCPHILICCHPWGTRLDNVWTIRILCFSCNPRLKVRSLWPLSRGPICGFTLAALIVGMHIKRRTRGREDISTICAHLTSPHLRYHDFITLVGSGRRMRRLEKPPGKEGSLELFLQARRIETCLLGCGSEKGICTVEVTGYGGTATERVRRMLRLGGHRMLTSSFLWAVSLYD